MRKNLGYLFVSQPLNEANIMSEGVPWFDY